jgi:hypothetical protein
MQTTVAVLVSSVFWCACGADDAPGAPDGGPRPDAGAASELQRAGFIHLTEGGSIEVLMADLRSGLGAPVQKLAAAGDCAVYTYPGCDPDCGDRDFAPAGTITVTGLREPMSLVSDGNWYMPDPYPSGPDLFAPGAEIAATAPGDVTGAFALTARGVAPLVASVGSAIEVEDGVDETITWTAENDGRIRLALRIGWHIRPPEGLLTCDTDDDGELVIPGELIAALPRQTGAGEPHYSWMGRVSTDVVDGEFGPIELLVGSLITIGGVTHLP